MPQTRTVSIPFVEGLDRKSDPWQIPIGKFYALVNTVFTKTGRLTKRNGYKQLTALPGLKALGTFQGGLVGLGSSALSAYSSPTQQWFNKGAYQPLALSTASLVRSANTETQCDVAVSSNGLTCTVFTELVSGVSTAKYAIFDSTGNAAVGPTTISSGLFSSTSHSPRVFATANYFVIVFAATISAALHLQYLAIPLANPAAPVGSVDITTDYAANGTSAQAFDGVVAGGQLYVAWNTAASGIKMTYFDAALNQYATTNPDAAHQATHVSVTADTSGSAVIWVTYYSSSTQNGYTLAVGPTLSSILAATQVILLTTVANLTSAATGGVNTILYEVTNWYLLFGLNNFQSNYIHKAAITQAGSITGGGDLARGVGLGSKAFLVGGSLYVLAAFSSLYQSTYFLLNSSGQVVGKLAYQNAPGLLTLGLPAAAVNGTVATIGYLVLFQISPVNKGPFASNVRGVYAQAGINAASWNFAASPTMAELGGALHISGGQLWMFDGTNVVEHGFHLFPELNSQGVLGGSVSALWYASPATTSATTSNGSPVLTAVGNTNILIGTPVSGTGIPANTVVTGVLSSNSISLSQAATASGTITLTIGQAGSIAAQPDGSTNTNAYYYQYVYQWTDAQGNIHRSAPSTPIYITTTGNGTGSVVLNIPVLRMTLKSSVQILIFRWSVGQQVPYQVTSVTAPLYNDPNANSPFSSGFGSPNLDVIAFVDTASDGGAGGILGNSILYTFGGTLENNPSPPTNIISEFDSRLWVVDAEYPSRFAFSQQVVQGTPVEMSSLLTYYVSPTLGAQGAPGNLTAAAPMDEKFVFHKSNAAIFYLTGTGPDATGANSEYSQPVRVETTASAVNAQLGVFSGGHLFQSDKGIWALFRNLSTAYQGAAVEDFTSKTVVSAVTVPNTTQVRVTLSDGSLLMYDYFRDQWGSFQGPNAAAGTLFQGLHTYLDLSGRVFQETPGSYVDEGGSPVLMSFTTGWINPAGLQGYQRAYWAFLLGRYLSPHKLTVGIAYDRNPSIKQQLTIAPDNFDGTWGSGSTWGSDTDWGGTGDVEQWQVNFKQQDCQSFQLTVTEQFDPSKGQAAGAGFTLSGIDLVVGVKKGYPKNLPATRKTG